MTSFSQSLQINLRISLDGTIFIVDTKLLAVKYNELFIPATLEN